MQVQAAQRRDRLSLNNNIKKINKNKKIKLKGATYVKNRNLRLPQMRCIH